MARHRSSLRRSRRNPITYVGKNGWVKEDGKWVKQGGASAPRAARSAHAKSPRRSSLTVAGVRKLPEAGLLFILNHPKNYSSDVYAAADLAFNGNE